MISICPCGCPLTCSTIYNREISRYINIDLVLSYLKDIVFDVFNKGFENVKLFSFECKLFNIVVEVGFKLLIDNIELVDNEFKLLNIVVDVAFK